MQREYINKLFHGEIQPQDSCEFETKEYNEYTREFTILYREIQSLLPEERKNNLESHDRRAVIQGKIIKGGVREKDAVLFGGEQKYFF